MKKILISTGELSGDEHGADLVGSLLRIRTDLAISAMGGSNLKAAGANLLINIENNAGLMGFAEVLFAANSVIKTYHAIKNYLHQTRPDLLILIDYPDFNLRLAKEAHALGIPVFYYITPKVWAWRTGRIKKINKVVDLAAVIFPFERQFFEQHGFTRSIYVGHPFTQKLTRFSDPEAEAGYKKLFLLSQNLDPLLPVLAVFPGSRKQEVQHNMQVLLGGLALSKNSNQKFQTILSVTPAMKSMIENEVGDYPGLHCVVGKSLDVLRCADAGLLKSGTSNLQAAFYGLPFSMFYRTSLLSEAIARSVLSISQYSIVNIIQKNTVKELIQRQATPLFFAKEIQELLFDEQRRKYLSAGLKEVVQTLSSYDPHPMFENTNSTTERAAKLALSLI